MKLTPSLSVLAALAALALAPPAMPAEPELQIPNFSHLRAKAVESVDLTLDGFLLKVAKLKADQRLLHADVKSPHCAHWVSVRRPWFAPS